MDKIHATHDDMLGDTINPVCGLALPVGGDDVLVTVGSFRAMGIRTAAALDVTKCRECVEITSV